MEGTIETPEKLATREIWKTSPEGSPDEESRERKGRLAEGCVDGPPDRAEIAA
jgi:hypothetical protein